MNGKRRGLSLLLAVTLFFGAIPGSSFPSYAAKDHLQDVLSEEQTAASEDLTEGTIPEETKEDGALEGTQEEAGEGAEEAGDALEEVPGTEEPVPDAEESDEDPEEGTMPEIMVSDGEVSLTGLPATPYWNYYYGDADYSGNYYVKNTEGEVLPEIYTDEVDEILLLAEAGMDLKNFFHDTIFDGFTKETLLKMQEEGYSFSYASHLFLNDQMPDDTHYFDPDYAWELCNPLEHKKLEKYSTTKEGIPMSISELLAVLGFALSCFGAGYTFGKDSNKTQK